MGTDTDYDHEPAELTDAEADRLWNHPRCPRCPALESRLKAAIIANSSLKRGMDEAFAKLEEVVRENKKLTSSLAELARFQKWGRA